MLSLAAFTINLLNASRPPSQHPHLSFDDSFVYCPLLPPLVSFPHSLLLITHSPTPCLPLFQVSLRPSPSPLLPLIPITYLHHSTSHFLYPTSDVRHLTSHLHLPLPFTPSTLSPPSFTTIRLSALVSS